MIWRSQRRPNLENRRTPAHVHVAVCDRQSPGLQNVVPGTDQADGRELFLIQLFATATTWSWDPRAAVSYRRRGQGR
jgi:hypothetical protein